jgi:hypothetical protein
MRIALRIAATALGLIALCAQAADNDAIARARESAVSWLVLVDSAKFAESWDHAASLFKGIPKSDWEQAVRSARAPLGAIKSRKFKSATVMKNPAGAPAGDYILILFDAQFEKRHAAVEAVTPMREKDGSWKVSGYYIK